MTGDASLPAGIVLPLRIGTRASPLALRQAEAVRAALMQAWPDLAAPDATEIVPLRTTGDRITDRPLAEIGGKGLFAKELEHALLAGQIDIAVHSMKDMETWLPDGLAIAAMLPREDPRDVLIAGQAKTIADLPEGAVIGSASVRRRMQLLALRPDFRMTLLRGNVGTRLDKIAAGEADATLLALAGLRRLGQDDIGTPIAVETLLPAVGQGAVGVEIVTAVDGLAALMAAIDDPPTSARVRAERAYLAVLDGSCHTPIAGLAELDGSGGARFRGLIGMPDGSKIWRAERSGAAGDLLAMAEDAGRELRAAAGEDFAALLVAGA